MAEKKDKYAIIVQWFAFGTIAIGLAVLIGYLIQLSSGYTIFGKNDINPEVTGQVGDFIGGFVGAIWALTGVLLFYAALRVQKKELEIQREELTQTRKEFEVTRMTNIIYKQIEIAEANINRLEIDTINFFGENVTLKSYDALNEFMKAIYALKVSSENKSDVSPLAKFSHFFKKNLNEIDSFFRKLSNIVKVVKATTLREKIDLTILNELKMIFFTNTSHEFLLHLETIKIAIEKTSEILKENKKIDENEMLVLKMTINSLKSIIEFKNNKITNQLIKEYNERIDQYNDTRYTH